MPEKPRAQAPYVGTAIESPDEIREALQARLAALGAAPSPPPQLPALPTGPQLDPHKQPGDTPLFRPTQRPPMALLCVVYDGEKEGQWTPLWADRYVLGRTEGDIRIPHDVQMSSRHAELRRVATAEGIRWSLSDLSSTNGTYVRVGKTLLRNGQELIFGNTRYRFDDPRPGIVGDSPAVGPSAGATQLPKASGAFGAVTPALVLVNSENEGPRIPLVKAEYVLGRDAAACAIVPPDDPFVSPRHAKFLRLPDGRWRVENEKSVNGVWLRIDDPMPLSGTCQFRLGEQRFILRASL